MFLYQPFTQLKRTKKQRWCIWWYCLERVQPVAPYEQILEDFHLYPEEPRELTELEQKIQEGAFTEEERELFLTDLDESYPEHLQGLDLKKEEVDFFANFRYAKDEARRGVNELFTRKEVEVLEEYLRRKYGYTLVIKDIRCPIDNIDFQGYCRDPWDCDDEADFLLHEDPDFPLGIPAAGFIKPVQIIRARMKNGRLTFEEIDENDT